MKRLVALFCLILPIFGCLPGTAALYGTRLAPDIVEVAATLPGTLIVSGQREIISWEGQCERVTISAGANYSLACLSPQTIQIQTDGRVSVQIIDGYRPVTRPVVIE